MRKLSAIEINEKAVTELHKLLGVQIHHQSILDYDGKARYDFVLIKGVLIHLNPDKLPQVYDVIHQSSARYICVAEYYNPRRWPFRIAAIQTSCSTRFRRRDAEKVSRLALLDLRIYLSS